MSVYVCVCLCDWFSWRKCRCLSVCVRESMKASCPGLWLWYKKTHYRSIEYIEEFNLKCFKLDFVRTDWKLRECFDKNRQQQPLTEIRIELCSLCQLVALPLCTQSEREMELSRSARAHVAKRRRWRAKRNWTHLLRNLSAIVDPIRSWKL